MICQKLTPLALENIVARPKVTNKIKTAVASLVHFSFKTPVLIILISQKIKARPAKTASRRYLFQANGQAVVGRKKTGTRKIKR